MKKQCFTKRELEVIFLLAEDCIESKKFKKLHKDDQEVVKAIYDKLN